MNLRRLLLIAFVFSGMAALIYEIVWIRPLQYILGSTIYTISIIFAAFMLGLALGSWIISKYVDKIENLPRTYALMELGIGLYGVLLISIFNFIPSIYRALFNLNGNFYIFEFTQLILSFAILIIPTALMGATFPIIAKFYTKEKIGKGIGEIYSANNIGAIIGSFAAGFILIPLIGIKATIIFAGVINLFVGSLILFTSSKNLAKKVIPISIIIFILLATFGNYNIHKLYVGGFNRAAFPEEVVEQTKILFYKEGLHASVNVAEENEALIFLINGYGQGSTFLEDTRVNFLLAYLPVLIKPQAENALVIGLGTGTTSGHLNEFVKTTTVEIEPVVVEASKYFWFVNRNITENKNHNLIIDDARNYLLRNKEKYDFIVSEPTNTWQSFSTSLFSKEFFHLINEDLKEDGLYLQWIPTYDFTPQDFKNFYKTFNSEFPYVIAFVNLKEEQFGLLPSEIILIGSKSPINYENIEKNFDSLPDFSKDSFEKIGINSVDTILNLMIFTNEELKGYADKARIVTDDNALLEFSTAKNTLSISPYEAIEDINKFILSKEGKWNLTKEE